MAEAGRARWFDEVYTDVPERKHDNFSLGFELTNTLVSQDAGITWVDFTDVVKNASMGECVHGSSVVVM
jgi:hypothetical protein